MASTKKRRSKKPERQPKTQPRRKWTPIDEAAAGQLIAASSPRGLVYPLDVTALPESIQAMPGVVSYYVSNYTAAVPVGSGITVGGELAVVRTDADLNKAYNYVFATSSDGRVYFNGPYKDFPQHHFAKRKPVIYFTLFGHTPFSE